MNTPPRTWISNKTPQSNELVRVRALIEHPMESGFRIGTDNQPIARQIVHSFKAYFNDELLFEWLPETAISQNPYIEFTFIARRSGQITMQWTDDLNQTITAEITIAVNA